MAINEVDITKCKIWEKATLSYVNAATCFKRNREIAIQLKAEQYTAGLIWSVQLVKLINSPDVSGEYLSDTTFYQEDGETRLNSYTQILKFRPSKLNFPDIKAYPNERYQRGVIDIQVTVPFDIPVSRQQNITTETISYIYVAV